MEVTVTVSGLRELEERMSSLPANVNRRAMRKALTAGALVLENEMKALVAVKQDTSASRWDGYQSESLPEGAIRDDITHKILLSAKEERGTVFIGPSSKTAHVARWLELGHWLVVGSRKGNKANQNRIKWVPAKAFMRPTFDRKADAAVEAFTKELKDAVNEATNG